jgi:hypothetical protein
MRKALRILFSNRKETLERASERQVETPASNSLVITVLQFSHAVVVKARRAAPDSNITVSQGEFLHGVITL